MPDLQTTLEARQSVLIQKAKLMLDTAEREQRGLTPEEEKMHGDVMRDHENTAQRLQKLSADQSMSAKIAQLTAAGPASFRRPGGEVVASVLHGSPGEQFLKTDTFNWLQQTRASRPSGQWSSPSSELQLFAATLTEDPASGGNLVVPQYLPGIRAVPTRPLTIADLIAPGTTDSNAIVYMRETAFANAADAVAEGATKPESALTFVSVTDPVRKVAHWLPVTEEMLEDVPSLRSYLDTRLRHGVDLAVDDQLLNGTTVAPDITGILNRTGLAAAVARGTDTNADAVLKQIAQIQTSTMMQATGIVMHPTNWLAIQLAKNDGGDYVGSGPFTGPQPPTLWGLPVAVTPAIAAGTALVGAFRTAAQLFWKGGLRVEATNAHADFFIKNLIAIRAEARLALAVYRPAAFGLVTGLA